ncbi:hypothetical protein QL285_093760 [Trifolium repens]|nr:hypothetical protein QL285_093760 [Trifolium repens]
MSDILFSQLCLRVPPATAPSFGDDVQHDRNLNLTCVNKKSDIDNHALKQDSFHFGVVYMALVGTFPFNFLLSRVLSCVVEFKSAASSSTHPCNDSNKVSAAWGIGLIIGPAIGSYLAQRRAFSPDGSAKYYADYLVVVCSISRCTGGPFDHSISFLQSQELFPW